MSNIDTYMLQMKKHNISQRNIHQRELTHWGRVTHICVSRLTITGSDNGLSPGRRQAIISNNARILLIGLLGTNFSEINRNSYIFIHEDAFENVVRNGGHFVSASMS